LLTSILYYITKEPNTAKMALKGPFAVFYHKLTKRGFCNLSKPSGF
jgi:hypothetical protein